MKIALGAKRTGEEREPSGATLFTGAGCAGRPSRREWKVPSTLLLGRGWGGRAALARLGCRCSTPCARALDRGRSR